MPLPYPKRLEPKEIGRRYGVRSSEGPSERVDWDATYDKPANLAALTGSEGIDNSDVVIRPDGTLGYDGTGGGTVDALQIANAPAEAGATANTGALADEDEVGPSLVSSGYALVVTSASDPTSSSARLIAQTTSGVLWYDTGSTVFRLNPEAKTGTLGSDTGYDATAATIVALVHFPGVTAANKFEVTYIESVFQGPDNVTDISLQGRWEIYIIRDDLAAAEVGDAIGDFGTTEAAWQGSTTGLTFHVDGGNDVVNGNDIESSNVDSSTGVDFYIGPRGTTFVGGVTVALSLALTTGGGGANSVLLDGDTTFTVRIS